MPSDVLMQLGKCNPRFSRGRQEDSHEALKCIFDALKEEEIQPVKRCIESLYLRNRNEEKKLKLKEYLRMAGKVPTAIGQVIEGKIMSFRICHECHDVSESTELFFDISLPMPKNSHRAKNINGVRGVYVEWPSPNTQIAIPSTSDAVLAANANNNNAASFAELDAMLAELDALLIPDVDPPNSTLQNTSLLLTELGTPSVLANGHLPNNSEGSDAGGQLKSASTRQSFANTIDQNSHSAPHQTMQQDQHAWHKCRNNEHSQNHSYLITHDKDHFQEYLSEEGLHHQLKSKRRQHDMNDLQLCLSLFTDLDVLDENNKFVCKACTAEELTRDGQLALCRVSKQIIIHELPPVLILHMKRFEINHEVRKDDRHISFPEILDMAPYCTCKCVKELGDSRNRILYSLYAVIVHLGDSLYNGHYTAFVKVRPAKDKTLGKVEHGDYDEHYCRKGQWYFTSDTYVRKCSLEEVKKSKAYVLFYERLPFIPIHDATMV